MFTTIVTIGRNVTDAEGDDHRLPEEDWRGFKLSVFDLLMAHGYRLGDGTAEGWFLSDSNGTGFWDGVEEENYSVTLLHERSFDPKNYEEMRNELKRYGRLWHQEAIALIGEVRADLVPAETREVGPFHGLRRARQAMR